MNGELDLSKLLQTMTPELRDGVFVFATLAENDIPQGLSYLMRFQESEGTTLILSREEAEGAGIPYQFPCRMITLNVHSSLEAVGFIAVIATRLAQLGMGVNPVAGFYHDHLFVPENRAEDAMNALQDLARSGL